MSRFNILITVFCFLVPFFMLFLNCTAALVLVALVVGSAATVVAVAVAAAAVAASAVVAAAAIAIGGLFSSY